MHPKVDALILKSEKWQNEMTAIQSILLECGLTEDFKWSKPCYTYNKDNIAIVQGFKAYFALLFFKGALLQDAEHLLQAPGENSQSGRQFRFKNVQEILNLKSTIKAYIYEAIELEKAGLKLELKTASDLVLIDELLEKFKQNKALKLAFDGLTPGRKRAYNMYFSAPKQSKTRVSRIQQHTERILRGKGINDCICGHSKHYPQCDGSHKLYR